MFCSVLKGLRDEVAAHLRCPVANNIVHASPDYFFCLCRTTVQIKPLVLPTVQPHNESVFSSSKSPVLRCAQTTMNVLSIDICTTIYVALTLYNRASRALEEIKAHRSRFEKTEALLKLVEGIRRSKTTTTTIRDRVTPSPPSSSNPSLFSEGCEVWIDQNISCTEHVLSEIEEVIKLEREVERLSWKEKIEWVMRHKSVVENLGVRLDQCYLSLMATLIMLELAYQIGGRMGMGSWRGEF
jgi:hypothetical protein